MATKTAVKMKLSPSYLESNRADKDGVAILIRAANGPAVFALQTVRKGDVVAVTFDDGGWLWFSREIQQTIKGARRYVRKVNGSKLSWIVQIDDKTLPIDMVEFTEIEASVPVRS